MNNQNYRGLGESPIWDVIAPWRMYVTKEKEKTKQTKLKLEAQRVAADQEAARRRELSEVTNEVNALLFGMNSKANAAAQEAQRVAQEAQRVAQEAQRADERATRAEQVAQAYNDALASFPSPPEDLAALRDYHMRLLALGRELTGLRRGL